MCETPFAHVNSRMTFDFVYVKKRTIFLNLTLANFKNSLNSAQFADLNSPDLGLLKSRASECVFEKTFVAYFTFCK